MKICSKCLLSKPLAEFHKRSLSPDGLAYKCKCCVNEYSKRWKLENPDSHVVWYARNKHRRSEDWKAWYEENKIKRAKYNAEWVSENRGCKNANIAARKIAVKRATVAWGNKDAMRWFYDEAARLTKETGVRHEVDHIYPLQGKYSSGLHWEGNMQILTRSENARKRNKMPTEVGNIKAA